jgi:hypothetical protein
MLTIITIIRTIITIKSNNNNTITTTIITITRTIITTQ